MSMAPPKIQMTAIFPQAEIGTDPGAIVAFTQAVEAMGYDTMIAYDHIVGANPASRPGATLPYTHESLFHEPMTLFAYLAGFTSTIRFSTGVLILPQRQTVLVAKQAANVDIFCNGRLRLAVGIGWNPVEYEALGMDFRTRGARLDEQIPYLRKLWTQRLLTEDLRFDRITDAGIHPLPLQQPIPIWVGGNSDAARGRAARLGDGWLPYIITTTKGPQGVSVDQVAETVSGFYDEVRSHGRDPGAVGVESIVFLRPEDDGTGRDADDMVGSVRLLEQAGATGAALDTQFAGLEGADAHIAMFARMAEMLEMKRR